MIDKPLRLGVLGGGSNSAVGNVHRIACTMDGRWKVTAGCFSTDHEENVTSADLWGIDSNRRYDDWEALIAAEQGNLDALLVLTPTPTHFDMVVGALKAGFHVICEKSLSTTSEEAEAIEQVAREHERFVAVTYNYSGYPLLRQLREIISSGGLGAIAQIHVEMPQEGFIRRGLDDKPAEPQEWRLQDGEVPTLSLDLGVHLHQAILFLTGLHPKEVVATQASYGAFSDVVDTTLSIAKYEQGVTCQFWQSKAALGYRNGLRLRVFGDRGSAEWLQTNPEELRLSDQYGRLSTLDRGDVGSAVANEERYTRFKAGHPSGFIEAFANYYVDIADALIAYLENGENRSAYVFGASQAAEGLRMLEAMQRSATKGQWEPV